MARTLRTTSVLLFLLSLPVTAGAWEYGTLRLRGRLQTRFEVSEWISRDGLESGWVSSLRLRRARIDGRWEPADWIRLVLEIEATGWLRLNDRYDVDGEPRLDVNRAAAVEFLDAYSDFRIEEFLKFRLGQFKKPFSRLRMQSPFSMEMPVRGLLNGFPINRTRYGGYGGRDVGAMVWGRFRDLARLTYHLGVFNGPRFVDQTENSDWDYVVRLQVRPFKGFRVAVNASHKVYHHKEGPTDTPLGLVRGHAYTGNLFGADARFKWGDLTLMLEGAFGDNVDLGPGHLLWGAHGIAAYAISLGDEWALTPAVMVEGYEPDTEDDLDPVLRFAGAVHLDIGEICRFTAFGEFSSGEMWTWEPEEYGFVKKPPETRFFLQAETSF